MSEFEGEMDVATMKVADLKKELRRRGLSAEGKKQELIERLLLDDTRNKSVGEEFLGEEEADTLLNAEDDKSIEEALCPTEEPPKKKVAINRDINIPNVSSSCGIPPESSSPNAGPEAENDKKEPSKLTDKERSDARKERFASQTPTAADDKKAARAARFGLNSEPVDVNKLKQRSERFGQVNSSTIKKIEDAERIKKRQERFGVVTGDVPLKKVTTGVLDPANDEKLKKRAERFGVGGTKEDEEKKKLRSLRFGVAAS